jgi:hypothetical protein
VVLVEVVEQCGQQRPIGGLERRSSARRLAQPLPAPNCRLTVGGPQPDSPRSADSVDSVDSVDKGLTSADAFLGRRTDQ